MFYSINNNNMNSRNNFIFCFLDRRINNTKSCFGLCLIGGNIFFYLFRKNLKLYFSDFCFLSAV